jgi:hypothetical protein
MRLRLFVLVIAALAALAVPSGIAARTTKSQAGGSGGHQAGAVLGTWNVEVSPDGQATFPAMLTFTGGGGLIETESDQPGTGQGSWKRLGSDRFALAFRTFIYSPTGTSAGSVLVRTVVTLDGDTLSGPFKFDVSDAAGSITQSGSGTATAKRFEIPDL